jgi:acyl dehydratase
LSAGDELTLLRVTPERYVPYRYAGAAEDFNPVHLDAAFARSVGLESNILHGLYVMGLMARGLLERFGDGDPRRLRGVSVQFRAVALPEKEIVIEATVTDADERRIVVSPQATQEGTPLIRNATAELDREAAVEFELE